MHISLLSGRKARGGGEGRRWLIPEIESLIDKRGNKDKFVDQRFVCRSVDRGIDR